ncbi:MAG: glycosyltransferase [Solobacterium sp.]|nr:glycosyltransferase [Solobacterium sp.]
MKVMILCGYLYEGIGQYFDRKEESFGGWVKGFMNGIRDYEDLDIYYAAVEKGKNQCITKTIDGITFHLVSYGDAAYLQSFLNDNPCDVYHLFGMENEFAEDIVPLLDYDKTLFYIQGIIDEYKDYYLADYDRFHGANPLFKVYMYLNRRLFEKRGRTEKNIFRNARYIAGRTDWDKAYVEAEAPGIQYFKLNESLRDEFYQDHDGTPLWDITGVNRHTIFVTQANYPVKSPHMIVEIVRLLKQKYPDVKCYIGGEDISSSTSLATKLGVSYASYIQKLIKQYGLQENIKYIGYLNAKDMVKQLCQSNVFLLASAIENSPNSLQEAMAVGVPCVSSFVGGVSSLVSSEKECKLYPYNDPKQAAYKISQIFADDDLAGEMSLAGYQRIRKLIDIQANGKTLHDIYVKIDQDNKEDKS